MTEPAPAVGEFDGHLGFNFGGGFARSHLDGLRLE
jgi:hypothetical protein